MPVLVIKLHGKSIGYLFKYALPMSPPILRFVASPEHAALPWREADVLSESMRAAQPEQQQSFWLDVTRPEFNAVLGGHGDYQLPPFFQNLLPEGAFRRFVAEEANIQANDHMAMLAACGKNMAGAVTAEWEELPRLVLQRLVTQNQDALEVTVAAEPFQNAISISGVQPKIGVNKTKEGRFVGRTTALDDVSIIAKLPSSEYARMPEVEGLCMHLARIAGADVCEFDLVPLRDLAAPHRYDLGDEVEGNFLAVTRFDRNQSKRVHFEDFAQVFSVSPERKYTGSYLDVADVLLSLPRCGEAAVHELVRRIEVNELLGNADMHLKNMGLLYRDRRNAELAPAYDITSTLLFVGSVGHALHLLQGSKTIQGSPLWRPSNLRDFANALGLQIPKLSKVVQDVAAKAAQAWLDPILQSKLTERQKQKLLSNVGGHPHIVAALKRLRRPDLLQRWKDPVLLVE
ncbi:MAG: type II toxin-antitoxin system HipA family toxin [Burkholderiaceae bacterium]